MIKKNVGSVEAAEKKCCSDCIHAELHRWGNNPLIARCLVRQIPRQVANATIRCDLYQRRTAMPAIIEHNAYGTSG